VSGNPSPLPPSGPLPRASLREEPCEARSFFGEHRVEILDWIQADGHDVRSLAFTDGHAAWTQDG
jgi:hypothetical protein